MKKIGLCENEIYEAVMSADGDEREAYDFMAMHTDIVFNEGNYNIRVDYDDETKLFKLHGDIDTDWISHGDCIEILCCIDSALYDLPCVGEYGVTGYSSKLIAAYAEANERRWEY